MQITDEVKQELRLLRLRGAYDPKRFYKVWVIAIAGTTLAQSMQVQGAWEEVRAAAAFRGVRRAGWVKWNSGPCSEGGRVGGC